MLKRYRLSIERFVIDVFVHIFLRNSYMSSIIETSNN